MFFRLLQHTPLAVNDLSIIVKSSAGILLLEEFISEKEESTLVNNISKTSWADSQSGRRKQVHYASICFISQQFVCYIFIPYKRISLEIV